MPAKQKQKRRAQVYPQETQADRDQPGMAGPPSKRTRGAQQRASTVLTILEEADSVKEAVSIFNSTMTQMGLDVHCETGDDLQREMNQIHATCAQTEVAESLVENVEVNKASKCYVEIMTDLGPARMSVPATTREVLNDPHAEEWLQAD